MDHYSPPSASGGSASGSQPPDHAQSTNTGGSNNSNNNNAPTVAVFSPASQSFSAHRQRSTILVHQKSPLLLATPPQVTRALAYSHPFIVPLNKLAGLLSWTTDDAWESFLMVAAFWLTVLYGDYLLRWAGPMLLVSFLIAGMYFRRYSPLSSTGWTGEKQRQSGGRGGQGHRRDPSDSNVKHRKSLDQILDTLHVFTTRCNILLDPFLRLTDFLSTQQTATSATTQPALTTLFIRIMLASPFWWALALPPSPLRLLTAKRIVLVFGTLILSWHSRPARISRTILWRSRAVRQACTLLTGLKFGLPSPVAPPLPPRRPGLTPSQSAAALANMRSGEGIRFTFSLYENQRRWLGIGWTSSMLAYERTPWTDEHLNACPDPQHFQLPEVEGGLARWRWVEGSEWRVETGTKFKEVDNGKGKGKEIQRQEETEEEAWIYYDNKWRDGRRGQDGWGRYTRRRKWVRDAELVDVDPDVLAQEQAAIKREQEDDESKKDKNKDKLDATSDAGTTATDADTMVASSETITLNDSTSASPTSSSSYKRSSRFANFQASISPNSRDRATSSASASLSSNSVTSSTLGSHEDDVLTPTSRLKEREADWGLGDDVHMVLG